ncbi:GTPase Era [uncultured Murdochiella sp.]|uniref:GTPase Era n=1 Tax=uncultured Murdochiella sp. TaxID=1586095 RepID=UPI002803F755|nr:GTPase Era [uncultured Murdochiella sp.]
MNLLVDNRDPSLVWEETDEKELEKALRVALHTQQIPEDVEISLSFVNGEEIRALNAKYRGKDTETDVLSFPVYEAEEIALLREEGALDVLGDIVINMERVRTQAEEFGHSEERERIYLAVHSLLHLLGFDHEDEEDKRKMRREEKRIMRALGFAQPFHSGYVAVIGRPNVGKSTLITRLLGEKLSIISNKPQTTRHKLQFIMTDERMQAIFLDTPGVQIPKNALGETMLKISREALEGVDLCLFVTDVSSRIGPLDRLILERLKTIRSIPLVLLLNKIDLSSAEMVEAEKRRYEELGIFRAVLPISAKEEEDLDALTTLLYELLPEGPQYFPDDMVTDRSERFIITEMIREKCLYHMQEEIPHGIHVGIDSMKKRSDRELYDIYATIYCEKLSHKGMVIGKGGTKLGRIGREARKDIEALIDCPVNLKLWVKVDKNWRKNKQKVDRLGFD